MAHLDTLPASGTLHRGPLATLLRALGKAPARTTQAPPGDAPLSDHLRRDAGLAPAPDAPPSTGAAMLHLMR